MSRKIIDLINQKFGKLIVISEAGRDKRKNVLWKCLCGCGEIIIICGQLLRYGKTKSCGCFRREVASKPKSEETKKKMSETGKKKLKDHKNHPNYNPNLSDEDRQHTRRYPEYREWRTFIFERDDYTCQICSEKGGNLIAHHLEGYTNNPELRTTLSNGITLCKKCHKNFHHQYGNGNNTKKQFKEFKGGII